MTGIKKDGELSLMSGARPLIIVVLIIAIVIAPVALLAMSLINVPAGHKAVVVNGFDVGKVYDEGWQWKNPLQGVELLRYNTQSEKFIGQAYADDNVGNLVVNSKDNVAITIDFQVVYHLDPTKVGQIRVDNGNYRETIVVPVCRSVPRDVCANFEALDIRGDNRSFVAMAIQNNISAKFLQKYIIMEEFALQEISLPPQYEDAITAKKVAEQNVITQGYNLEAQSFVATQTIVNASASANVTIIDAAAKAEAIQIIMHQFNITNETEASQIYLRWLYIRALTDPNSNIEFIVLPEGDIAPLINIDTGDPEP